ncbi:flagellar biosynthesis anti-sigma factor FlgM [Parasphingorhabdus sp. JC815]|uniref:flagellar biosynthesis anti-sigma factor FlgM n=1 Tax=Parasphingorhabdus sp. JC815 TaxID=3232140 RepID=UPI003458BCD8
MIDKMIINANQSIKSQSSQAGRFDIRSLDRTGHSDRHNVNVGQNSKASSLTGAIDHMVKHGMPIDMQHITAIRTAIVKGHYPVDSAAIADAMMEFDRSGGGFL